MAETETRVACLVVEDEDLIRLDIAELLKDAGYITYEAANAAEAILILEHHPEIRVMFTDIQMPGEMDGLQLSHYVAGRWPPTVLVICSARVVPGAQMMPAKASFLPKPYQPEAFGEMLAKVAEQLAER